jgi:hypothetical protein
MDEHIFDYFNAASNMVFGKRPKAFKLGHNLREVHNPDFSFVALVIFCKNLSR